MITDELKKACDILLDGKDLLEIAKQTGFSFQYVRDIKGQKRHNLTVANALRLACLDKGHEFSNTLNSIKDEPVL